MRTLAFIFVGWLLFVSTGQAAEITHPGGNEYLVLDDDLTQLKHDFNAARGSVRLVFIVGPTCGICLRGMADLNDAFLGDMQGDARLQTFVVHVPVLGATEAHIKPAMGLLNGPNIYHYWDPTGISGKQYSEVLDTNVYAWDVWFAYGPDAEWQGALPPPPAFWQHQLGSLPAELHLNAKDFAARTMAMVQQLGNSNAMAAAGRESKTDDFEIGYVAQSPDRAEMSYVTHALGGRANIDSIVSVEMTGSLETANGSQPLTIKEERPNVMRRSASALPQQLADRLNAIYDFEGLLLDWRSKGNELAMRGMVKLDDGLAWRVDMTTPDSDRWELLIDSHSGSILRERLISGSADKYLLDVGYGDFQETGGILFPHRIEYRDGAGQLIATEHIDKIHLTRQDGDPAPAK